VAVSGLGTEKTRRMPFDPDSERHVEVGGNDLCNLGIAKYNFASDI
jgi:hypothetical protein